MILKKLGGCRRIIIEKIQNQFPLFISSINKINSNEIFPIDSNKLFEYPYYESDYCITTNRISQEDLEEILFSILNNYKKILIKLTYKNCKEKAICIANILKINRYLGDSNYTKFIQLGQECENIVIELNLDKNEKWYKEFKEIYEEIKENYKLLLEDIDKMRKTIKLKYKIQFDEIENKFLNEKNSFYFIKYILKLKPYKGFENDIKNKNKDFNAISKELIQYLVNKYNSNIYNFSNDDEQSLLNYFIIEEIELYLNQILIDYNDNNYEWKYYLYPNQ